MQKLRSSNAHFLSSGVLSDLSDCRMLIANSMVFLLICSLLWRNIHEVPRHQSNDWYKKGADDLADHVRFVRPILGTGFGCGIHFLLT